MGSLYAENRSNGYVLHVDLSDIQVSGLAAVCNNLNQSKPVSANTYGICPQRSRRSERTMPTLGCRQDLCANLCRLRRRPEVSRRNVVHGRLQVLHVHVFLAAPLGACLRGVASREPASGRNFRQRHPTTRVRRQITVQPLDHVVGAGAHSMLAGKIAVSQSFLNAVLDLFGGLLQLHGARRWRPLPSRGMLFCSPGHGSP